MFDRLRSQQENWDYSFNEFKDTQNLDSIYYNHLEAIQIALKLEPFE